MIEEALSGTTPQVKNSADLSVKTQAQHQAAAKTTTNSTNKTAGRSAGRNERLISHLLIGFMMTVTAIAGYTFLGPHTDVNAAEQAGSRIVNVATEVPIQMPQMSTVDSTGHMNDLAMMQAEMDAITQQMNALNDGSIQFSKASNAGTSPVANVPYTTETGGNLDQAVSTLDQMMLTMHEMINKINSLNQQGGAGNPANSAGHGHH